MERKKIEFLVVAAVFLSGSLIAPVVSADWWDDITEEANDWYDDTKDKANDWYEETTDDAQDWYDDTKDKAEDIYEESKGQAEDWYEETKDDAQDWYDDTKDKAEDIYEESKGKAEDWYDETLDDTEDWWSDAKNEAIDWYDDTSKNVEEQWNDATDTTLQILNENKENWKDEAKDFQELFDTMGGWKSPYTLVINDGNRDEVLHPSLDPVEFTEFFDYYIERSAETTEFYLDFADKVISESPSDSTSDFVNLFGIQTYSKNSWDIIAEDLGKYITEKEFSENELNSLDKRRGLITEASITSLKIIPVYDIEDNQVKTLDQMMREMVGNNPYIGESDLAKDPLRTGALLLFDNDYMNYGKIIPTTDGTYMSIEEAYQSGYNTEEIENVREDYAKVVYTYAKGDPEELENDITVFQQHLSSLTPIPRQTVPFSTMYMIIALISIILIVTIVVIVVKKRKKRKME